MKLSDINLSSLKKAVNSLQVAIEQPKNEFTRDASIQRFKYSYEFCWKTLRRYLEANSGIKEYNVKNIFREAAKQNLIENVNHWFVYHEAWNLASHTYNAETAEEAYQAAIKFLNDALKLIKTLDKNMSDIG